MSQGNTIVVPVKSFVLKVNVDCKGCENRVRKKLRKIDGVYTTTIEAGNGTVTVLGNVDPQIIIKKLKKIGKHAELLPSEDERNQPDNEVQSVQAEDGQTENPKKGGKVKRGHQQPQVSQAGGMEKLRLPSLNDMQLPSQVPLNLGVGEGDVGVDEISETDIIDYDDLVDELDEVVVPSSMKARNRLDINQGQQQSPVDAASVNGDANGNQGGRNGAVSAKNKSSASNNNPTNGNGGKMGGRKQRGVKNLVGAIGVSQNDEPQQATGAARKNNDTASDTSVVNNDAAGIVKGRGAQTVVAQDFNGMDLPGGAPNIGNFKVNIPLRPMSNVPLHSMGYIPVAPGPMPIRPELNMGGQFQGPKSPVFTSNPYHQQYPEAMMTQPPPPYGMYPLKPAPYLPQPWLTGVPNMNYFSEEEPNGCSIM